MRLSTVRFAAVVVTAGVMLFGQPSDAVVRPKDADPPRVSADRGPRPHRTTSFVNDAGGLLGWTAIWDHDTDVPLRMWGAGQLASGSVANAAAAESAARQFLAANIRVLAPGASVSDFELVSNTLSRNHDLRSVGFVQRSGGVRVAGGAIGFAFKADRLVMVSSTALPNVAVAAPLARISPAVAAARATSWLASAGFTVAAKVAPGAAAPARVILPIVRPRTGAALDIDYRLTEQLTVESLAGPGRWEVWVDSGTGAPIARRSLIHYATGKVLFDVSDRHPNGTRSARPSIFATHTIDGSPATSTSDGTLTWVSAVDGSVVTGVTGPLVAVTNGTVPGAPPPPPTVTATLTLPAGGNVTWSDTTEFGDANLTAFIYANEVKQFAKTRLNPELAWLNGQLSVFTNEPGECNAYSTGDDIHFFPADGQCQNTGRMADVVYHEFGHSVHIQSIIDGVGDFDGAFSEGVSDFLASLITNDSGMGRGFFFTDAPLREINPVGAERRWPEDATGGVHKVGEIIGGTLWDLRVALEAKLGREAGYEKTLDIYYSLLQRSSDIPSSYAEALLADDDDGNVTNGTPNKCEIDAAFGAHGLADPSVSLGVKAPTRDGYNIAFSTTGGAAACPGAPSVQTAVVEWKKRGGEIAEVPLAMSGAQYTGTIPTQPEGTVVQYKVTITLSTGTKMSFPNNPADPLYEFYVGPVTVLQCFGFEGGFEGWTHGAMPATNDEWEASAPFALSSDPKTAFKDRKVLGLDLARDGAYRAMGKAFVDSPEIDVAGNTQVRLQFYRWLGVEDGFYDKARIYANGVEAWSNFTSMEDPGTTGLNHVDQEWRFVDVDLSAAAASGKVKVRFEIDSDAALELGGWSVDEVCIVAVTGLGLTCGNSEVDDGETCDDGNRVDGDGCSANCVDEDPGGGGGCCSTGTGPVGAGALSLLTLGFLVLRRRRR